MIIRFSYKIEDYKGGLFMAKAYDLTGKTVGKLLVLSKVPVSERPTQNHGNYWLC